MSESQPPSVLVIDDDNLMRDVITRCLQKPGYVVSAAINGADGLSQLSRQQADLVITDILMPDSDGLEVIVQIRRLYPATRILAISGGGGSAGLDYLKIAAKFGADSVLNKPFAPSQLLAMVNDLLKTPA